MFSNIAKVAKAVGPAVQKAVESRPTTMQFMSKSMPAKAAKGVVKMLRKKGGSTTKKAQGGSSCW